eukprot:CAMPEP_0118972132 /NCGR_PEP_ID=MMETSP1173-20130426/8543_1 /TAXON_ID=1034831 /ORGANISM="Rhizochromulina marina cf, Strain CCMP1243" /LENGTH=198 /DNA_ID=CAMNT_0006921649 /DNA_START=4 /DNA_END=597 /DNA_ORIENTATION=+
MARSTIRFRQNAFQQYLNILLTLKPLPEEVNYFLEVAQHCNPLLTAGSSQPFSRRPLSLPRSVSVPAQSAQGPRITVSDFALVKVIGQGSFGKVFLVKPKWTPTDDKTVYAMKVVKKSDVRKKNQLEHTKAERRIMAQITHPFIITLFFAFQSTDKLYMVTEYCSGGELFFHLKRLKRFREPVMRFFVAEVACALDHL